MDHVLFENVGEAHPQARHLVFMPHAKVVLIGRRYLVDCFP